MNPIQLSLILTAYARINELLRVQRAVQNVQEKVEVLETKAIQAQSAFQKLSGAIKNAFNTERIQAFSEKLESLATKAGAVGAGLTGAVGGTVYKFMELEDAKTQMEIAFMEKGGKVSPELEKINKLVMELGNKLPGTTADFYRLAQALREQGVSAKVIAGGALKAAAYLGALFKVDYAEAGEMVAKFQEAFKVPEKQLVKFVDLVQRAKYAFGLNLQDIYYSVKYFSGQLNTLGITGMENAKKIMAWAGVLASVGVEGSTAGTAIANVLSSLTRLKEPPKEVAKILETYGIQLEVFDAQGKFKGLDVFFKEIQKLKVLTQEERLTVLKKLFGEEGERAISPLVNNAKALEQALQRIEKQASLQKRIDKLLSTTSAKWEAFIGNIENLLAQLGSYLAPTVRKILNFLIDFTGKISDFLEAHKTTASVILHVVGALGLLFSTLSALSLTALVGVKTWELYVEGLRLLRIQAIATRTATLGLSVLRTIPAILFLSYQAFVATSYGSWLFVKRLTVARLEALKFLAVKTLTSTLWLLKAAFLEIATAVRTMSLALLTNPIFWIGMAIVGIATLIYKYWSYVKAFFLGFFVGLKDSITPVVQVFGYLILPAKVLLKLFSSLINALKNLIAPSAATQKELNSIAVVGKSVGYVIGTVLLLPLRVLTFTINAVVGSVKLLISAWNKLTSFFRNFHPIDAVSNAFRKLINFLKGINLFEIGKNIMESLKRGILSVVKAPVEAVKNVASSIVNKVKNFFGIRSPSTVFMEIGKHLNLGLFQGIMQSIPVLNKIPRVINAVIPKQLNPVMLSLIPAVTPVKSFNFSTPSAYTPKPSQKIVNKTFNVTINVRSGNPKEIERVVKKVLKDLEGEASTYADED